MDTQVCRILVVNGKGGCGKTTVATNLASTYAAKGHQVALIDHDPQASSTFWCQQRSDELSGVHVIAAHERSKIYQTQPFQNRIPVDVHRIIIDAHSASRDGDIQQLLKNVDVVLIPILPSSIDIRAGGQFIAELLTHRSFRNRPIPVGVIANRVQPNTPTHEKLNHFLSCLDVPAVATFRDSPVYNQAAEIGGGVVDLKSARAARREMAAWYELVNWIERQPKAAPTTVQALRARAAARHQTTDSEPALNA